MNKILIRDVGFALESNNLLSFLDKQTSEIIHLPEDNSYYDDETAELVENMHFDQERYIRIEPLDSRSSFGVMQSFAENQPEGFFKKQLFFALNGRHPFGRFKGVVHSNEDLRQQWFKHKDEVYEAEALSWLTENGIDFEKPSKGES